MRWLLLAVVWLLCLGVPVAFINWQPGRSASGAPKQVSAAPGQWSLQWHSSVALAADPFAMDDEAGLRLALDGERWQWQEVAADERGQQDLPKLRLEPQRVTLHALPASGQAAGAIRLRLLRDEEAMAEQVWWVEPGEVLSASWQVDIPRLERQRGR